VLSEILKDRTAACGIEEGGDAGGLRARRAAGDGERKSALSSIKVSVLGKRELKLMPKGGARTRIIKGAGGILFASLLKLSTLCWLEMSACIQGRVDSVRQESEELVMHHIFTLRARRKCGRSRKRGRRRR
jgi:hypothetical protein